MFVEIPRKQDLRPNRHRKAPEIRQYLALDANALDPWRIGFARDGRDLFGERQGHRRPCSRIEPDIHGLAIGIARKHRSDDTLIAGRNPDDVAVGALRSGIGDRSEEHTSELQSLMRISYAVFCLKKK